MWWPASASDTALEGKKLTKFVELLVHDYLQVKGFEEAGAKFAEECSRRRASDDGDKSPPGRADDSASAAGGEAGSWYYLAGKLCLTELLRKNAMTTAGQRLTAVMEILVKEMVRQSSTRSCAPSSVSIATLRDAKGRRRRPSDQTSTTSLELQRSTGTTCGKSTGGLDAEEGEILAATGAKEGQKSPLSMVGGMSTNLLSGGRGDRSAAGETGGGVKERGKTTPLQVGTGGSRSIIGARTDRQDTTRKVRTSSAKRIHGHSSPPKGGRRSRDAGAVMSKFQFSKDSIRRHQRSRESWIPEDLRMKMMRRSMRVIEENVFENVAQCSLVRKEKKRSSRSELEIVKTQEKFGTKHQRPCALCEQSFSEVNLVLAVPFKAIVDLRIAWQKALPQANRTTTKTNRTMLMPPQCYNEVKVCAFCSQLFHDPLGYRPTWDMETSRLRKKQEHVAREKEREYWDPLRKAAEQEHVLPGEVTHKGAPSPLPEVGA